MNSKYPFWIYAGVSALATSACAVPEKASAPDVVVCDDAVQPDCAPPANVTIEDDTE